MKKEESNRLHFILLRLVSPVRRRPNIEIASFFSLKEKKKEQTKHCVSSIWTLQIGPKY
jgi:hypothetical protein